MSRIFVAVGVVDGQKVGVVYKSNDDACELCSFNECSPERSDLCGYDGYLVKLEGEDLDEKEAVQLMLLGEKVKTPSMMDCCHCEYRPNPHVSPFRYVRNGENEAMNGTWGQEVYRVVIEEPMHTITIDGKDIEISAESYKKLKESLCPES